MNDYHLYEEIGRGRHSEVYKGRKKKTIIYSAIKGVEKCSKAQILHEVKILHNLDHPNVMKFYQWYETGNHIWLILEYCTGGDLLSLLMQDMKLPESTIIQFTLDILLGLQYVHSRGILYADLKPSKLLIGEEGRIKLSDFGLAVRLDNLLSVASGACAAQGKRGTPCYMAPELFRDGGVYSFASDLWALGCVMYEMAAGHPPFVSSSFSQLMHLICNEAPRALPGYSPAFNALITSLLTKDPSQRMTWATLCQHEFFCDHLEPVSMPLQPQFEAFLKQNQPKDVTLRDESDSEAMQETPDSNNAALTADSGANAMRLSQIVQTNLNKTKAGDNYRTGAVQDTAATAEGVSDISLGNPNDELDFREVQHDHDDDDTHAEDLRAGPGTSFDTEGSAVESVESESQEAIAPVQVRQHRTAPTGDQPMPTENTGTQKQRNFQKPRPHTAPQRPTGEARASLELTRGPTADSRPSLFASLVDPQDEWGVGDGGPTGPREETLPLEQLLFHASDFSVRPIVPNKRTEVNADVPYDAKILPVPALPLKDFLALSQTDLEAFLTTFYKALAGSTPVNEKTNALQYFEDLCSDSASADIIINSSLMLLFVKLLKSSRTPAFKARLAFVVGLLIRHATFISEDLQGSGVVTVLTDLMRERNDKVKRRVVASLGELLFYIATQRMDQLQNGPSDAPEVWTVPPATLTVLVRCLKVGEDEVVQHYACKTIDNIASQSDEYGVKFATLEVLTSLFAILQNSKSDSLRPTASSAAARVLRFNRAIAVPLLEKIGILPLTCLLSDPLARVQQGSVNVLNLALTTVGGNKTFQKSLHDEKNFLPCVLKLLEHSSSVMRAKALLTIHLLCTLSPRWLLWCCEKRVVANLERFTKDKDTHVRQCLQSFLDAASATIPSISATIISELQKLTNPPKTAGTRIPTPTSAKGLPGALSLMPILVHFSSSKPLRSRVFGPSFIEDVSSFVSLSNKASFTGHAEFVRLLLLVLEGVCQNSSLLLCRYEAVMVHLLAALLGLMDSDNGDTRFVSLKMLTDILALYFTHTAIYDLASDTAPGVAKSTRALNELLISEVFPRIKQALGDDDPIPTYGLKLLATILDRNAAFCGVVQRNDLIPRIMNFLKGSTVVGNSHILRVVKRLLDCTDIPTQYFFDVGLCSRVGEVFEFHCRSEEADFEAVLDIIAVLLFSINSVVHNDASPLDSTAYTTTWLPHIEELGRHGPLFLRLSSHQEVVVADKAAHCVLLVAQLSATAVLEQNLADTAHQFYHVLATSQSPQVQKRLLKTLLWIHNHDVGVITTLMASPPLVDVVMQLTESAHSPVAELANQLYVTVQI